MIGRSSSSLADQQKYTSERIDEIMTMMQGVEYNNRTYYCTARVFSGKLQKQAKLIEKCVMSTIAETGAASNHSRNFETPRMNHKLAKL